MRTLSHDEIVSLNNKAKKLGKEKLRTAIYARKSAEDERNTSLPTQIAQCRAFIQQYTVLSLSEKDIYQEDNVSGMFTDMRKQYLELMDKAARKEIDVIVVMKLDRLARDLADATTNIKLLSSYGCILLAGDDVSDTSNPAGEFMRNILLAQNQYHARRTASDVMSAECNNAKNGDSTGGTPPYGLRVRNKRFEIDEKEAQAVRIAFDYCSMGKSYKDIITHLSTLGFRTRNDKPFSYSTLSTMLRNPKYCGTYIYNKIGAPKKKNRVLIESFDEIRNEEAIPPIISKEKFEKVQVALRRRNNCRPNPNAKRFYPLTGFLFCASCGASMSGDTQVGRAQ